ncbi:MAG: methionine--tRNA ligase subunit beta [Candidatus ainarchaeum sp.]|nr:methionine--tRNA ligase subunit beta [Candidatus ainarchaeum sp.]
MVTFAEWQNLDLRVGLIEKVEEIPLKDKIYKLTVNFGTEIKTVISGIKPYYQINELEGKKVAFVYNLDPAKIAGFESQAMILGAMNQEDKYKLIFVDDSIKEGTKLN